MAKTPAMSPLRKYRKDKGWRLKKAAPYFGLSISYLSDLETGKAVMSVELAKRIEAKTKSELTAIELLGLASA